MSFTIKLILAVLLIIHLLVSIILYNTLDIEIGKDAESILLLPGMGDIGHSAEVLNSNFKIICFVPIINFLAIKPIQVLGKVNELSQARKYSLKVKWAGLDREEYIEAFKEEIEKGPSTTFVLDSEHPDFEDEFVDLLKQLMKEEE